MNKFNPFAEKFATTKIKSLGISVTTYYMGNKLAYKMYVNGKLLFKGIDFRPSPLRNWDDIEATIDLLAFLSTGIHDTDLDYFNDYTGLQMDWAIGYGAREQLSGLVSDASDVTSEYYENAIKAFNHKKH